MIIEAFACVLLVLFYVALVVAIRKYGLYALLAAILLLVGAIHLHAQDCDALVVDQANILGSNLVQVGRGAQALVNQGADVRVRTFQTANGNLDLLVDNITRRCNSWQNASGGRKSTLLVLAVSMDHKVGIYYGSTWNKALSDHYNRIKQQYMVPRLKDRNFAGAFIAAEEQISKRIAAAQDEALHPAVSTTNNNYQSHDYSGVWKLVLFLLALGGLTWLVLAIVLRKRQESASRESAQGEAVQARNRAAAAVRKLEDEIRSRQALVSGDTPEYIKKASAYLDRASTEFSRLSQSVKSDPDTDGLPVSSYAVMAKGYESIEQDTMLGFSALNAVSYEQRRNETTSPSTQSAPSQASTASAPSSSAAYSSPSSPSTPVQSSTVTETHIHHHHHNDDYVAPVSYPVYVPPPVVVVERERDYEPPAPAPAPSRSSDDDGGGSSSWFSSSSSSSSDDSSSSSSSSWSSSSDSGGGSSSWDSGSSFDSGSSGGGSSDW